MKHADKITSLEIDRLKAIHRADREMFGHFRPMVQSNKKRYNRAKNKRQSFLEY